MASGGNARVRRAVSGALLVLLTALAAASVLARFAHGILLDTDRYVQAVAPLSANSAVRDEVSTRVTALVMERSHVQDTTVELLQSLADAAPRVPDSVVGLAPVLSDRVESFVRRIVDAVVASDEFGVLWTEANTRAHGLLVTVLTGENGRVADDGSVSLSLGPVVERVREQLTVRGFTLAESIPDTDASLVLIELPRVAAAQRVASALDSASAILPWVTGLVGAAAVGAAPVGRRRRAVSWVGGCIAMSMVALAVVLAVGRALYLDYLSPGAVSPEAAAAVFDAVVASLRMSLRAMFVLGLSIAVIGFVIGSSRSATRLRDRWRRSIGGVRTARPTRRSIRAARSRVALRTLVCTAAALTLVFWNYPSGADVVVVVLLAVAVLLVVEVVAYPAVTAARRVRS